MDHFEYRDGRLLAEDTPLEAIADAAGTPTYVYSAATMRDHFNRLTQAFAPLNPLVCYSIKSCSNLSILRLLAERSAGMDVVSGGELHRAKLANVPGHKIVYAGVGKSDHEIREALEYKCADDEQPGIRLFNIESEAEFENIARIAESLGVTCDATLRVNPDVDPHTHEYTTTGKKETKFGVDIERARQVFEKYGHNEHCRLRALHLHIGSPVYTVEPYVEAVTRALALIDELSLQGFTIDTLNMGGGFGADYESQQSPMAKDYADALIPLLKDRVQRGELSIVLEPGRSIAANAGVLLARVQYVKESGSKTFVIIDAGMHTLIRPALYSAFHFIWPVIIESKYVPTERKQDMDIPDLQKVDIVGPICESGDFLAKNRNIPPVTRGDLIAVFSAGAYGSVMASRYNSHGLPAEVLVDGSEARIIRKRESYFDLVSHEMEATAIDLASL